MGVYKLWRTYKPTIECGAVHVGQVGEMWWCPQDNILRIGDGVTPGGIPVGSNLTDTQQYDRLVDVEGDYTYVGEALPGTAQSTAEWRIKRIHESGEDINIIWADGTAEFEKAWDDRATYTYS